LASPRPRFVSLICILAIFSTLGLLYVLPDLIRTKQYSITLEEAPAKEFPLDMEMARYDGGPPISLRTLLKAYPKGLIVNFWGTWCPPCLDELPSLEILGRQLAQQGKEKAPQLMTISVDEKTDDIKKLLATLSFRSTFPILLDPLGKVSQQAGTTKFPETYWLATDGQLLHKWVGPQNWAGAEVLSKLAGK